MILEPCYCSWDITGIDRLPAHHHCQRYEGEPPTGQLVPDISIWVEWREVARALSRHRHFWQEPPSGCVLDLRYGRSS
jgi:hypothetical protein